MHVIQGGAQAPEWYGRLRFKDIKGSVAKGPLLNIAPNVAEVVRHDPAWLGVLGYDEFSDIITVRKQPPWPGRVAGIQTVPRPWTDADDLRLGQWLTHANYGCLGIKASTCREGVILAAMSQPFHPVREWYKGLKWDGVPRLDSWLTTYLGVAESDYARCAGRMWLISAAARIFEPGCEAHHVLILEGPQGVGKSTALRILFQRRWYTDSHIDVTSKDAYQAIRGVRCAEFQEMDAVLRADDGTAKGFLTSSTDRYRPPYGRDVVDVPRQCVIAGTVNPGAQGYLKDATGARRFWPQLCAAIALGDLERDQEQLHAEAYFEYLSGRPWHPDPTMFAHFAEEQGDRFAEDSWESIVSGWVESDHGRERLAREGGFTMDDVFRLALDIPDRSKQPKGEQMRVGAILTRLGFRKRKMGSGKNRTRIYVRDDVPE